MHLRLLDLCFTTDMPFYCAAVGRGPTLLLVRDTQGQVFGGYASQAWQKQGKFYGALLQLLQTVRAAVCSMPSQS